MELSGELDRQVNLELIPSSGTADARDFDSSSLLYLFPISSETGRVVCGSVGISRDEVVESSEIFAVNLQTNPEDRAVIIVQSEAEIVIADSPSDSKELHS